MFSVTAILPARLCDLRRSGQIPVTTNFFPIQTGSRPYDVGMESR